MYTLRNAIICIRIKFWEIYCKYRKQELEFKRNPKKISYLLIGIIFNCRENNLKLAQ